MAIPPVKRPGPRLGGIGLSGARPFISSTGILPVTQAVLYRVFKDHGGVVQPGAYENAEVLSRLELLLGEFMMPGQKMETWEWIKTMPNRRRKALVRSWAKYTKYGKPKDWDKIKPFVKTENLPLFAQYPGGYGLTGLSYVARLIQAPADYTHLIAGPYLKPLIKRLKSVWNEDNWLFYASVDPSRLDKWLRRNKRAITWFWADYSAFDATYSEATWKMIKQFYRCVYPDAEPEFWEVLNDAWEKPRGSVHDRKAGVKVKYQAGVCNASGRDDTALANALVNGVVLAMAFSAALHGVSTAEVTEEMMVRTSTMLNIAVVGDDSLVACNFDVMPLMGAIEEGIKSFGLVVKAEASTELLDVTFLGMMPYPVAGEYYWGPTLGRRLYKAYWQSDPRGNLPAWTRGVAEQMLQFPHVPILYEMAQRVDHLLTGFKKTKVVYDQYRVWAMARSSSTPPHWDESTLVGLCHRYRNQGLTVSLIHKDLSTLETVERLPAVVRLYTTDVALEVDGM